MKRFLIPMLIDLYLIQLTMFIAIHLESFALLIVPAIFILLALVLAFINIGCSILRARKILADKNKQKAMSHTVLLFKLLAVPFYALNYLIWGLMTGIFIVMPGNIFFLFIAVPLGIGFTFLVLLSASSYSIALLFVLKKNGEISLKKFILHTICQLVFVIDVVDQIIILKFTKPAKDKTAV